MSRQTTPAKQGGTDKDRGKRIVKFMKIAKLSRDECARRTSISQGVITKIRAGDDRPFSEMVAVASTLNISLDAIAGISERGNSGISPLFIEKLKRLPNAVRRDIVQLTNNIDEHFND